MKDRSVFFLSTPLHQFVLMILFCISAYFLICGVLIGDLSKQYGKMKGEVASLEEKMNILTNIDYTKDPESEPVLSGKKINPRTDATLPSITRSPGIPQASSKIEKKFSYILIDKNQLQYDPTCKECYLNEEGHMKFIIFLQSTPDTIYFYSLLNNNISNESCSISKNLSECLRKYFSDNFSGNAIYRSLNTDFIDNGYFKKSKLMICNMEVGEKEINDISSSNLLGSHL